MYLIKVDYSQCLAFGDSILLSKTTALVLKAFAFTENKRFCDFFFFNPK